MKDENILNKKEDLLQSTYMAFEKLGITYFSYGLITQGKVLSSCFSKEEWGRHYKEKHYDKTDPLLRGVVQLNFSLIIWDALHPFGKEKEVMMERNEICGIKSGLTLGIKEQRSKEIIALGANILPKDFYKLLKDEKYIKEIYEIIKQFYNFYK